MSKQVRDLLYAWVLCVVRCVRRINWFDYPFRLSDFLLERVYANACDVNRLRRATKYLIRYTSRLRNALLDERNVALSITFENQRS